MVEVLDLSFLGHQNAIASFLIPSSGGPILVESGPHSTLETLEKKLSVHGYELADIKHVFLTHIHLDHAGAAWVFAKNGANIYLHPFGAKNMIDPSRLMESARMIYKDDMDRLWGRMEQIDESRVVLAEDQQTFVIGDVELQAHHTPGHAKHHIAWQFKDILFSGDVAGVKIDGGPVVAPCPPPDIHIGDWLRSIQRIKRLELSSVFLTHFGEIVSINSHLDELEQSLKSWAIWIKDHLEMEQEILTNEFLKFTNDQLLEKNVNEETLLRYEAANPPWMSVAGLTRYWKKHGDSDSWEA